MSEETMSPVTASEPPSPLGGAASPSSTLKLKPVIRKPVPGGVSPTRNGLRPGLKLPPKPGLKPGGTGAALKPALRSGTATSVTPGSAAPAVPKPETVDSMEQLKTITQSMKSITAPIPQQAILRRTGIIADQDLTEEQKMAAKARTSRISLSDAIGVAPGGSDAAPMKTIRIKRPTDIPGATKSMPAQSRPDASGAADTHAAEPAQTITQRKTLKIARPQGGVKPQGRFVAHKSTASAAKPASAAASNAGADEVADIPDLTEVTAAETAAPAGLPDVPKGVSVCGVIFQLAACAVMGVLVWWLYNDFNLPHYCGGCIVP